LKVEVSSWEFEFQNNSARDLAHRKLDRSMDPKTERFVFQNEDALLGHLDGPGDADRSRFQSSIDRRLMADPCVAKIKKARTPLKDLKHFPAYRGRYYDSYHDAARHVARGTGSENDRNRTNEFDAEIASSNILLNPGQVLFHGRSNVLLVTEKPYPSYVSTTLNPIVALNSAYRRAGDGYINGRPTIFVLELNVALHALWGHVGQSAEWELLLPRGIEWQQTARTSGAFFDIVHAKAITAP
jgi:hypothetical protein